MTKVLIIDDAKFMRTTLANLLEKHNFHVVGKAENGDEGVKLFKNTAPDLVILDITMPVMDGLEALHKIIDHDEEANVIMCSAMGQQRIVIEAIELGAKDFIVKPFEEQRVIETVHRVLQTDRLSRS